MILDASHSELPGQRTLRTLGTEIWVVRHERKLSQEKLALQAGLSTTVIRLIEKGRQNFEINSLLKIAAQLEVTLEDLFIGAAKRP